MAIALWTMSHEYNMYVRALWFVRALLDRKLTAYIAMAYIVMVYIVMVYICMACII